MQEIVGGRYRLEARVGTGGMADVWQARDLRSGARVALKRLHPALLADPAARARVEREIAAAGAVAHPRLVTLLDAHVAADDAWLVMAYVAGGTLADRLRAGPMGEREAAGIAADVAEALAALHRAGIVHRDVTPANILLDGDGRALLGDLGIARPETEDALAVTATGDLVGTFRFMAPEQLAGTPASSASDVWALGAVLYQAVAGRPPFDVSSPAALLASQRTAPADPGLEDEVLGALLRRLLDPEPAARPDADTAAAALRLAGPAIDRSEDPTMVIDGRSLAAGALAAGALAAGALADRAVAAAPSTVAPAGARVIPVLPAPGARRRDHRSFAVAALLGLVLLVGLVAATGGWRSEGTSTTAEETTTPSLEGTPDAAPTAAAPTAPAQEPAGDGDGNANGGGNGKPDKPDKPGKGNGQGKGNGG